MRSTSDSSEITTQTGTNYGRCQKCIPGVSSLLTAEPKLGTLQIFQKLSGLFAVERDSFLIIVVTYDRTVGDHSTNLTGNYRVSKKLFRDYVQPYMTLDYYQDSPDLSPCDFYFLKSVKEVALALFLNN